MTAKVGAKSYQNLAITIHRGEGGGYQVAAKCPTWGAGGFRVVLAPVVPS